MKKTSLITILTLAIGIPLFVGIGFFSAKKLANKSEIETPKETFSEFEPSEDALEYINTGNEEATNTLSPFTGEVLDSEISPTDAFMCIIENSRQARPQSGLSQTDFLYEVMTEGGITRFMGIFTKNNIEKIGPIRSSRYYFLDIAQEFDLPFSHCGGSYDALEIIQNDSSLKSIDEMANGKYFYRDTSRKAPHNLYTSSEQQIEILTNKDFNSESNKNFTFDDEYWTNTELETCVNLELNLSPYYSTSYNVSESGYIKSMDGEECTDAYNNEPLAFDNIVIQVSNITNRPNESYMNIELTGSGNAYIISNGKFIKGTWEKLDDASVTVVKDSNSKIIPLSTGNTIWHIIDDENEINIY